MLNVFEPKSRAPYSVCRAGMPTQRAADLHALYRILCQVEEDIPAETRFYLREPGDLDYPIKVFDALGLAREDLQRSWYIRWNFGPRLHGAVDYGWDGDFRPRGRPIPGTGKRRWGFSLRYMRTQSERRQNQPIFEEGEPTIRGSRRIRSIPTAWEDYPRRDWDDRNWKGFRKTQWKARD